MTTVLVADLDAASIYWGLKEKLIADVVSGDVVFGAESIAPELRVQGAIYLEGGCDLPGGTQKWMPGTRRFEPLKRAEVPAGRATPAADRALYKMVLEFVRAGTPAMPQYTIDWALWYETTLDNDLGWSGRPLAALLAQGSPQ